MLLMPWRETLYVEQFWLLLSRSGLVQDALKVARRLSEEVLKVAGLSEDEGEGKRGCRDGRC